MALHFIGQAVAAVQVGLTQQVMAAPVVAEAEVVMKVAPEVLEVVDSILEQMELLQLAQTGEMVAPIQAVAAVAEHTHTLLVVMAGLE
jgi:hypothetical protein